MASRFSSTRSFPRNGPSWPLGSKLLPSSRSKIATRRSCSISALRRRMERSSSSMSMIRDSPMAYLLAGAAFSGQRDRLFMDSPRFENDLASHPQVCPRLDSFRLYRSGEGRRRGSVMVQALIVVDSPSPGAHALPQNVEAEAALLGALMIDN